MRSTRSLMSIEEAAGFAMAPSEDDMAVSSEQALDEALRNGHVAAATANRPSASEHPTGTNQAPWRDVFVGWWPGKAHA